MAKKSRFSRLTMSNNAHKRLMNYHRRYSNGENAAFIKMNYHSRILGIQQKKNRILSPDERKKEYNNTVSSFF